MIILYYSLLFSRRRVKSSPRHRTVRSYRNLYGSKRAMLIENPLSNMLLEKKKKSKQNMTFVSVNVSGAWT